MSRRSRVGLVHGSLRRLNIYNALDLVRDDIVTQTSDQVMIKPNFLSGTNQLASTHVDAVRGVIDFLLTLPEPPVEIIVAEGGNEQQSGEAFENFHYLGLPNEYAIPVRLLNLNQETEWKETSIILSNGVETSVRMPKTVLDCPCTISLALPKTHDACVVTLALKNMIMGTICKPDRIKMHGYSSHSERRLPDEAQILNVNLIRLSMFLAPDIAVIDGTRGLQGNGPGGVDAVDWGIAAASTDVFAADAVIAKAMGFNPLDLGLLHYANRLGLGVADLDHIDVLHTEIASIQQPFKPHDKTPLQYQWQAPALAQYLPV